MLFREQTSFCAKEPTKKAKKNYSPSNGHDSAQYFETMFFLPTYGVFSSRIVENDYMQVASFSTARALLVMSCRLVSSRPVWRAAPTLPWYVIQYENWAQLFLF